MTLHIECLLVSANSRKADMTAEYGRNTGSTHIKTTQTTSRNSQTLNN